MPEDEIYKKAKIGKAKIGSFEGDMILFAPGFRVVHFGKLSPEEWKQVVKEWRSMFTRGKIFCRHEYGSAKDLPPGGIMADVVYPNGVIAKPFKEVGSYIEKCAKCGRVASNPPKWL